MEIQTQWTSSYYSHKIKKDQYRIYDADEVDEVIERLMKEKEWLLNECARQYVFEGKMKATATMEEAKKWLLDNMQQALKE